MSDDVVEEFEVVVAGNAEDFGDAEFNQAVEQVVTDGVGGFSHQVDATRLRSKTPFARRRLAIVRAMAINETREIVIEASPAEILDVIADLESPTEWSPPHPSSEVQARPPD